MRSGSSFFKDFVPPRDSELVRRYRAAGFVLAGKTNTPEFGMTPTTEPELFGATRNPWDVARPSGGSSGGSAAAVATGLVPIAGGGDGGGSIRIPASCCGLFGLKPTRGRTPTGPDFSEIWHGAVVEHVLTRSVRDSAAVLDCTHGPEPGDPYAAPPAARPFLEEVTTSPGRLRIAFATSTLAGEPLDPECVAAVQATARLCEELGHVVEEASPPLGSSTDDPFLVVWGSGLAFTIDAFAFLNGVTPTAADFEPLTWGLYEYGKQRSASDYQLAVAMLQIAGRQVGQFHETYDCWLTPTLGAPPIKNGVINVHERDAVTAFGPLLRKYVPFTPIQNATGQPAVSLPLHWTADGLPVGVMFTGRLGDEATLYRLAGQLEQARPWRDRTPAVWD
jgi:amidase